MIFLWALGAYAAISITWVFYLATMAILRQFMAKKLGFWTKTFAVPVIALAVILDAVVANLLLGSILFLQLPREWLLTTRLKKNKLRTDWRSRVAFWFCDRLLNPFDPDGPHC